MKAKSSKAKRGKPTTSAEGASTSQEKQETLEARGFPCRQAELNAIEGNPRHPEGNPEVDAAVDVALGVLDRVDQGLQVAVAGMTPSHMLLAAAVLSNREITEALCYESRYRYAFVARFLADEVACRASCSLHDADLESRFSEQQLLAHELNRSRTA